MKNKRETTNKNTNQSEPAAHLPVASGTRQNSTPSANLASIADNRLTSKSSMQLASTEPALSGPVRNSSGSAALLASSRSDVAQLDDGNKSGSSSGPKVSETAAAIAAQDQFRREQAAQQAEIRERNLERERQRPAVTPRSPGANATGTDVEVSESLRNADHAVSGGVGLRPGSQAWYDNALNEEIAKLNRESAVVMPAYLVRKNATENLKKRGVNPP